MAKEEIAPLALELQTALRVRLEEKLPDGTFRSPVFLMMLESDLNELTSRPEIKERTKGKVAEAESIATWQRSKAAAAARVRRKADKLKKETEKLEKRVNSQPKYSNKEFTCASDFDKCRLNRGRYSTICALLFVICITKHGKELTKLASKGTGLLSGNGS